MSLNENKTETQTETNELNKMNAELNLTEKQIKNQIAYQKRKAKLALEAEAKKKEAVENATMEMNDNNVASVELIDEEVDDVASVELIDEEVDDDASVETEESEVESETSEVEETETVEDSEDEDEKQLRLLQKKVEEKKMKKMMEQAEAFYEQWREENAERVLTDYIEDQRRRIRKCCEKDPNINAIVLNMGCGEGSDVILTAIADAGEEQMLNDLVRDAYGQTLAGDVKKRGGSASKKDKKPVGEQKAFLGEKRVLGERENRKIFNDGELLKHQIGGVIKLSGGASAYNGKNVWTCRYRKDADLFRCKVEGKCKLTERVDKMVKKLKKTFEGEWVIGRELEGVVFQFESLNQFAAVHNAIWRPNDKSSCESIWKGGNVRLVRQDGNNEMMDIKNLPLL
jgi:hypothetical protein